MFFVSEECLRKYQETGDVGASTLGDVTPLGESLFPEEVTMSRIARGSPPARRIARAISMGHYQRDLV